jgi:hypothetical protein
MRLNLGCGRAQFPTFRDNPLLAHISYCFPDSVYDEAAGWINVDAVAQPGVDEVVDVFCYPWPWPDNSADEIWCSHLIEHIPHDARYRTDGALVSPELHRAARADGFYAWFYEAWRVLKPDAEIHLVTPYAFSLTGVSDPQHRRYLTPQTFGYLAPQNDDAPFTYRIPFRFAATGEPILRTRINGDLAIEEIQRQMYYSVNMIDEMAISLKAVKE